MPHLNLKIQEMFLECLWQFFQPQAMSGHIFIWSKMDQITLSTVYNSLQMLGTPCAVGINFKKSSIYPHLQWLNSKLLLVFGYMLGM